MCRQSRAGVLGGLGVPGGACSHLCRRSGESSPGVTRRANFSSSSTSAWRRSARWASGPLSATASTSMQLCLALGSFHRLRLPKSYSAVSQNDWRLLLKVWGGKRTRCDTSRKVARAPPPAGGAARARGCTRRGAAGAAPSPPARPRAPASTPAAAAWTWNSTGSVHTTLCHNTVN